MAKKKEIDKVKLSAFPEEVDKDGLKWYGEIFPKNLFVRD
jgi:hypothetical protein